jgi:hypothetical protein
MRDEGVRSVATQYITVQFAPVSSSPHPPTEIEVDKKLGVLGLEYFHNLRLTR